MSPQEQRFDVLFGLAGGQGVICPAEGQDQGGLVVSMRLVAAHDAAEGLLIRGRLARETKWQRGHSCELYAGLTVWAAIPRFAAAQANWSGIWPSWDAYK